MRRFDAVVLGWLLTASHPASLIHSDYLNRVDKIDNAPQPFPSHFEK